jgi:hypothetical protein
MRKFGARGGFSHFPELGLNGLARLIASLGIESPSVPALVRLGNAAPQAIAKMKAFARHMEKLLNMAI